MADGAASGVAPKVPVIPPEAKAEDIHIKKKKVFGPGDVLLGTLFKLGLFNFGETTIGDFFKQDPQAFPDISPSLQRVIQSVSENEGKIEAINTYDSAFLSIGIFQWTGGETTADGELPGVLDILKQRDPAIFEEYFGKYGLDFDLSPHKPNTLVKGFLTLNGKKLINTKTKNVLREPIWAYRFWRAAHVPEVRRAQVRLAMGRINAFYNNEVPNTGGRKLKDYVSSEYGVALLLDQHVNRPGHVPKTLMQGVADYIKATKRDDPAQWVTKDEREVLKAYRVRRASTSMTDAEKRAKRTAAHVKAGTLSDERGSFKP